METDDRILMPLYGGGYMDLLHPDPDIIRLTDIGRSLANQDRYFGHSIRPYTIAEHSVRVAAAVQGIHWQTGTCRDETAQGLLHDAQEAYWGELVRALKHYPAMGWYREQEHRMGWVVMKRFHLPQVLCNKVTSVDAAMPRVEILSGLFPHPWVADDVCDNGQQAMMTRIRRCYDDAFGPITKRQMMTWGWSAEAAYERFMAVAEWLRVS